MSDEEDEVSTILQARLRPVATPLSAFDVRVEVGPDQGASIVIDAGTPSALVGTGPACRLRLSDREVSRRHLALELEVSGLRVRDLVSSNGTFVSGLRIGDALLRGGERLTLGATTIHCASRAAASGSALAPRASFGRLLGASQEMRRLYPLLDRLAASDVPVILEGETGTGKEVLAESLHEASKRSNGPYVVFDCTAVAPTLLESELFGHERGAFTGALQTRRGVFEQAHGGTLLIDEIGDLDSTLQAKLLRAIERGEIRRVGGEGWQRVDVRVIAATRRDLDRAVQSGRFRDDLFHRLAVGRVELPPLRRRSGDVRMLVASFCAQLGAPVAEIPEEIQASWDDYEWPGNVRELRNAVSRRLTLGALGELPRLPRAPDRGGADAVDEPTLLPILRQYLPLAEARQQALELFEREYVDHMLERAGGNVLRASEAAGVARRYFQILKAKYGR